MLRAEKVYSEKEEGGQDMSPEDVTYVFLKKN